MAALQLDGVIHVLGLPPGHLHRVDVGVAVNIAYIYQHRSCSTDAGDGVVYMPLIFDTGVGYGVAAVAESAGEAEEVAHHVVGKHRRQRHGGVTLRPAAPGKDRQEERQNSNYFLFHFFLIKVKQVTTLSRLGLSPQR